MTKIEVNEIFYSLQGEGPTIGQPALFIRLNGCNLRCGWCDSKFTWNENPEIYSVGALINEIDEEWIEKKDIERVVITGGEPFCQDKALNSLVPSIDRQLGLKVEIETNGTIISNSKITHYTDIFNISPKLSSSGIPYKKRINEFALKLYNREEKSYFKFVVQGLKDFDEMLQLVEKLGIDKKKVIIMPEGTSSERIIGRMFWLAPHCLAHGFRLLPRLQTLIWEDKRGV